MKSIIAKAGAAKLITGAVAVAAIGGGVYAVNSLAIDKSKGRVYIEDGNRSQARIASTGSTQKRIANARMADGGEPVANAKSAGVPDSRRSASASSSRTTLADRISRLQSEQVTSSPQLIVEDGETSGNIHFNLQVVDVAGLPINGAEIKPTGLRTAINTMTWYGWGLNPPTWVTDERGIARAFVRQYTTEKLETGGITFVATHPDYTTTRADMKLTSMTKVVLTPGDNLEVIASDMHSSAPITGPITVEFYEDYPESMPDWSQRSDGTISIRRIGERAARFYLKHRDAAGNMLLSNYHAIDFPRSSTGPLYVTLYPTYTVRGRLSDNVQRPIVNGKVAAHAVSGPRNCGEYAKTEVGVSPDGTFVLENMPAGTVQIWALTDGYSSVRNKSNDAYRMTRRLEVRSNNQEYVLPMEPTASARFKLVDPQGNPVQGAMVGASPNLCREGCCGIWFNRNFWATSDANGIAVIENHPPQKKAIFNVSGAWELLPTREDGYVVGSKPRLQRDLLREMAPGHILEETLTVYPKGTFVISAEGDTMTTATVK